MLLPSPLDSVGHVTAHYDRVKIAAKASKADLLRLLPMASLQTHSLDFRVKQRHAYTGVYNANIDVVCATDRAPLRILACAPGALMGHVVTEVEIAVDSREIPSLHEAMEILDKVVRHAGKARHSRDRVIASAAPWNERNVKRNKKAGLVEGVPTVYFEDRAAEVGLKIYLRQQRRKGGGLGGYIVRIEFTLRTKAISRHLGGDTISALVRASLKRFVQENLAVATVDYEAMGALVGRRRSTGQQSGNSRFRGSAERTGHMATRHWAAHEFSAKRDAICKAKGRNAAHAFESREHIWGEFLCAWKSPAQIRSKLLALRREELAARRSKKGRVAGRPRYTLKAIEACFVRSA
ncbi:hypothetical protein [Bauldia litoralis]|uniref:Uncharacterized protein n=1 Tax=Bauldia litoralis TaxID=665467 RepID=A0A1G6AJS0_9HYPH|nr:hypothetical protein [Bauldia litoralis]SDB08661.1 hypothetical protein SAMN02982931_00745 [Bauldia litoralis]